MAKKTTTKKKPEKKKEKPKLTGQATDLFKERIHIYLAEYANEDPLFREKFENPDKNIDDCCLYIVNQVKKSKIPGWHPSQIYGMALHYYDEDKIDVGASAQCRIVSDQFVTITEAEKEKLREKARQKVMQEEMDRIRGKKKVEKKEEPKKKEDKPQTSLF
jgi:hypothetical protein